MRISSRNKRSQQGLTLTELLVTLAILSLMTGLSGIWLRGSLPGLVVQSSLFTLEQDLKQARLMARINGESVEVQSTPTSYMIEALDITRSFDNGADMTWETSKPLIFDTNGQVQDGGRITIRKGDQYGTIIIDPLTGKISSP